jgi:hypothetical protein
MRTTVSFRAQRGISVVPLVLEFEIPHSVRNDSNPEAIP